MRKEIKSACCGEAYRSLVCLLLKHIRGAACASIISDIPRFLPVPVGGRSRAVAVDLQ